MLVVFFPGLIFLIFFCGDDDDEDRENDDHEFDCVDDDDKATLTRKAITSVKVVTETATPAQEGSSWF